MYGRRLLIFLLRKRFRCKPSWFINILYRPFYLRSGEKHFSESFITSLGFVARNVWLRSLLAVECRVFGVKVKASNISHDRVECGVFSKRPFDPAQIVRYFYGTLVYSNLKTQKWVQKMYGEGIMSVIVEGFSTWGVQGSGDDFVL